MNKRYGRGGWFKESYRHYLAAKGVSTSRYTGKYVPNMYFARSELNVAIRERARVLQAQLSIPMRDALKMAEQEFEGVKRQEPGITPPTPKSVGEMRLDARRRAVKKLTDGFDLTEAEEDLFETREDLEKVRAKIRELNARRAEARDVQEAQFGRTADDIRDELRHSDIIEMTSELRQELAEFEEPLAEITAEGAPVRAERSDLLGDESGQKAAIGAAIGAPGSERRNEVMFQMRGRLMKLMQKRASTFDKIAKGEVDDARDELMGVRQFRVELEKGAGLMRSIGNDEQADEMINQISALQKYEVELDERIRKAQIIGGSKIAREQARAKELAKIVAEEPKKESVPTPTTIFPVIDTEKFVTPEGIKGFDEASLKKLEETEESEVARKAAEALSKGAEGVPGAPLTGTQLPERFVSKTTPQDAGFVPTGVEPVPSPSNREARRLKQQAKQGTRPGESGVRKRKKPKPKSKTGDIDLLSTGEDLFE